MTISNRTIHYNNAGVQCFEAGHVDAARDLFRAALQAKIANTRASAAVGGVPTTAAHGRSAVDLPPITQTREASEIMLYANYHLAHLQQYLQQPPGSMMIPPSPGPSCSNSIAPNYSASRVSDETIALANRDSSSSEPALYDRTFSMQRSRGESDECFGAANIFNLGLLHHLQDPASDKAKVFYQVALALLTMESGETGIPPSSTYSVLLRSAILNNLGVWYNDNGHVAAAQDSFARLNALLTATATHHMNGNVTPPETIGIAEVDVFYVVLRIIASPGISFPTQEQSQDGSAAPQNEPFAPGPGWML